MALVVAGTVAPMAPGHEEDTFAGRVWLGDDGAVDAVTRAGDAAPAGFEGAPVLDVGDAFVHPGLVDLHSHMAFNLLPLWAEPTQKTPFLHHDIWPSRPSYAPSIGWPAWTIANRAPESLLAYVQVRALAGGTTVAQGWPNVSRPPVNRLVRSADDDQVGPLPDPIAVSALTQDVDALRDRATAMRDGHVFIYHCAEGQPGSRVAGEFDDVDAAGCLQPGLVAIHCSALEASHFKRWQAVSTPAPAAGQPAGTVVWSPFSNLWLYGVTTDVPGALGAGLSVCLGTDWAPSGTKNLLGELKVARLWSDHSGWGLSDHDLAVMVTAAPGDALARAWQQQAGRIVPGGLGDVTVVRRQHDNPWTNLVEAREADVVLVVIGGQPKWGTKQLMDAAGVRATTSVPVGAERRRVALVRPDDPSALWSWSDVMARLDGVRADAAANPPSGPAARAGTTERGRRAAGAGAGARHPVSGDPPGTPPMVVRLDMPGPGGEGTAGPPPKGHTVDIPPIEPLVHQKAWLRSLHGRGFHGGVLDGLAAFYR